MFRNSFGRQPRAPIRVVVAAGHRETRGRILLSDRGFQLVQGPLHLGVEMLGPLRMFLAHRAPPPSRLTASTHSSVLATAPTGFTFKGLDFAPQAATPTPEPATLLLGSVAVLGMAGVRYLRRRRVVTAN